LGISIIYRLIVKRLGLMRFDGRRLRSDLIEAFKIFNWYYDVTLDLFFLHLTTLEDEVIAKSCSPKK